MAHETKGYMAVKSLHDKDHLGCGNPGSGFLENKDHSLHFQGEFFGEMLAIKSDQCRGAMVLKS
jgi:hypothetical protein